VKPESHRVSKDSANRGVAKLAEFCNTFL